MRLLILLLVPLFFISDTYAQNVSDVIPGKHGASLTIVIESPGDYTITIGSASYNTNGNITRINRIETGTYHIKIYEKRLHNRRPPIYEGSINITSGKSFLGLLSSSGRMEIYEQVKDDWQDWDNGYTEVDINALKKTLRDRSFDDSRLTLLQTVFKNDASLSAKNAAELLKIFDFDNARLSAAKIMYPAIYDKGNVFVMFNSFDFESNANEFGNWVRSY